MPDRIIYLVDRLTKAMEGHDPACVDDAGLNELMTTGVEVASTLPSKKVSFGSGRGVKVTPMIIRAQTEHKGLSVVREQQPESGPYRGDDVALALSPGAGPGGLGGAILKTLTTLVQQGGDVGHLGGARNHSMPGLQIVSGELVSKAFDAGQLAVMSGKDESACPFPVGSEPYVKWMQGYHNAVAAGASQPEEAELKRIMQDAAALARSLPKNAAVTCPHPRGSIREQAWVRGFELGGGTKA